MQNITLSLLQCCLCVSRQILRNKSIQVTVCGAGGKVGQTLSFLLKQTKAIDHLVLHDIQHVNGIAAELNHIDTKCKVKPESGDQQLSAALEKSEVVVIVANASKVSNPTNPAMFTCNAGVIKSIAEICSKVCPNAMLIIGTNPVNSLVPLACEVLRANKALDTKKVLGATSLNVFRANALAAEALHLVPERVSVPVIGGHTELTIIPILSNIKPYSKLTLAQQEDITKKIQSANNEVINLRYNKECAYLTCAYAIAKLVTSAVKGLKGEPNMVEHAYVFSKAHSYAKYFTTPLLLGQKGIEKDYGLPKDMSEYEICQMQNAISLITKDIQTGERFSNVEDPKPCDPCSLDQKTPCPPSWCQMV